MSSPQPHADDDAVVRAEWRLAMLQRLAEQAMAQVEAVKKDGSAESAEAFAKFSRAVRLTLTLHARLDEALRAHLAGVIPVVEDPDAIPADPYAPLKTGRKARVRDLVRDVIERETPDPAEHDALIDALEERLLCDAAYGDIENLPPRDIVERLCVDLDLHPDWNRWTGEGWTPNPPFFRPLCSLFATPSRRPLLDWDTEPDDLE